MSSIHIADLSDCPLQSVSHAQPPGEVARENDLVGADARRSPRPDINFHHRSHLRVTHPGVTTVRTYDHVATECHAKRLGHSTIQTWSDQLCALCQPNSLILEI